MARKKIGKILSGGAIVLCVVLFSMVNINVQAFEAQKVTFTISGSTGGVGGVTLTGLKDATGLPVTSDSSGFFSTTVDYGWTGTVTPELDGYRFNPPTKTYSPVTDNLTEEQFIPSQITFTVSGKVTMDGAGVAGVQISGLLGDPVTGADGTYTATVPYGWDGTVIPTKEGYDFKPPSIQYPPFKTDKTSANYTAEPKMVLIIGSIGEPGVTMDGLPGSPKTDEQGNYSVKVPYNWDGTVTPKLEGYEFNPPYIDYPNLIEDQTRQDYIPTVLTFTIAGNTEVDGVEMKGLEDISGQPVITDMSGYYSATVKYGFTGTVEPTKPGYSFTTASKIYAPVKSDRLEENYKASLKKMTISGKITGTQDVKIEGLPGVIIGKDGTYTATVDYGWQGMAIPMKEGYDFKPESRPYASVTTNMTNENYVADKQTFTISGSTTVPGVQVQVTPGRMVTSGPDATYTTSVDYGWTGTITPKKLGYEFEPSSLELQDVTSSVTNQSFLGTLQKMTISGKITDEKGQPVADIYVLAEPEGATTTTNAAGEYELEVDFQWRGKITPKREGYTFRLPNRSYPSGVTRDQTNQSFTAIVQTFTIRDSVVIGNTPVQGVTITAKNDQGQVTDTTKTDAKGQFTVTVPYGWNGEIIPTKAGLIFNPPSRPYSNITTNMKDGAPEIITQPPAPQPQQPPVPQPQQPPVPQPQQPDVPQPQQPPVPQPQQPDVPQPQQPPVPQPQQPPVPQPQQPRPIGGGLINNTFTDDDLITTVLPALSAASGRTIIADDTVEGLVSCNLSNVTLDTALDIVLAGTPYIRKETPYYILICSGGVRDAKFPVISETERIRLNYITAEAAVGLLSIAFTDYVKAETGPAGTDTYTVVITAPPSIKERIIEDLRKIDRPPAQVLLDARIVVMEKGDLLNLGVEWSWPTLQAGVFGGDNYGRGGAELDFAGNWPWGVQIGYSPDNTFTNALEMTLNLLIENSEASILAKPQVMAKDGKMSQIQVMQEEYYMLTPPDTAGMYAYSRSELQEITSGTKLEITPHVGDNNDITLQISVEVSDSIPRGRGSELPVVTRRTADNHITVKDGGTVALAGLSENRTRSSRKRVPGLSRLPLVGELFKNSDDDNASREIAVFITAHLVPQNGRAMTYQPSEPTTTIQAPSIAPMGQDFREELRQSLSRPIR
jgi:type II secretory pathway component GspD/PulD (secretin)